MCHALRWLPLAALVLLWAGFVLIPCPIVLPHFTRACYRLVPSIAQPHSGLDVSKAAKWQSYAGYFRQPGNNPLGCIVAKPSKWSVKLPKASFRQPKNRAKLSASTQVVIRAQVLVNPLRVAATHSPDLRSRIWLSLLSRISKSNYKNAYALRHWWRISRHGS